MKKAEEIKLHNLSLDETKRLLPDGLILLGYRGSIAHGTYEPSSNPLSFDDKDIMGVFVPPLEHYFGLERKEHHEVFIKEWDAVSYELVKFVSLLLKSNPNVLSLLWLAPVNYIYKNHIGERLIQNRNLFVTKEAFHSFNGYAWGQLKRMTHFKFEGYMGEKRKSLVEKFGYDTKNASHLIRLLEMGIEYLTDGSLNVQRTNATKLLSIKHGEWTLEQVQKEAERLFALSQESYVRSKLPSKVDRAKVNELLISLIEESHNLTPTREQEGSR